MGLAAVCRCVLAQQQKWQRWRPSVLFSVRFREQKQPTIQPVLGVSTPILPHGGVHVRFWRWFWPLTLRCGCDTCYRVRPLNGLPTSYLAIHVGSFVPRRAPGATFEQQVSHHEVKPRSPVNLSRCEALFKGQPLRPGRVSWPSSLSCVANYMFQSSCKKRIRETSLARNEL